ncbi:MAG: hypothetical protein JWN94_4607 [Betaproteobacteria bacterium]|nr:hypothetical protein [Betaproteobacteria bacterium]
MSAQTSKINPLVAVASVAVIIFSAVGVGVMTGVIPSSKSANDSLSKVEPATNAAPEAPRATSPSTKEAAASHKPAAAPRQAKTHVAANEPAQPAASRVCYECGSVDAITVQEHKGQSSALGVAGGAVVGGLLGNQIGNGRGNTVATVAGAVGGAVAGNEVEKRMKSTKDYKLSVRMEDGSYHSFTFENPPPYAVGERVKVVDGHLTRS